MADLLNILSNSNKDIDNQQLMDYVSGKMSKSEMHELEEILNDDLLASDAVEGLEAIKDKNKLSAYVADLNKNLKKNIENKNKRKLKRRLQEQPWAFIAILIVIILVIISYAVLHYFFNK